MIIKYTLQPHSGVMMTVVLLTSAGRSALRVLAKFTAKNDKFVGGINHQFMV